MPPSSPQPHPLAIAMEWVAKITTVGLEMFLPAVGGQYLDKRLGTNYWGMIGLAAGMALGLYRLLQLTKQRPKGTGGGEKEPKASERNRGE